MPADVKRQPASTRSRATPALKSTTANISNFTRTTKNAGSNDVKKNITAAVKPAVKLAALTPNSRKRKVVAPTDDDDSSADERTPTKKVSLTPAPLKSVETPQKRGRGRPTKKARATPASPKSRPTPLKRARSPSVSDSDTASSINTDKLFKRLRLESSPLRASSPLTADTSATESDFEPSSSDRRLPSEILSLINLYSSFLKTLTFHFAHNGTNVPVDLRSLCPNVARAWGKKAVTENDIRICLGVQNLTTSLLTLSDYGRGKICLEVDANKLPGGHLNEKLLNHDYHNKMQQLWCRFSANGDRDTVRFTNSLPKAPITICGSVAKAAPVLAKGQKRLEELKQGIALKRQEKEAKPAVAAAAANALTNPDGTKMSLLDRIRHKQLAKASLPADLSPAELARRAALHRVAEVTSLLGMLSRASAGGAQGRISFPMPAVLEKLKDSFRMGISREEGAVCIRILAQEVAPEWIRVVTIGERENVVMEASRQLSKVEAEKRVQTIIAKL
ncbi:uncharacterized protein PG998_002548 [Apiospora kogelbergensis]|uniref:DNA replication factor Cdt1 C-terminal domain-containing protein n=1 Tax=Apiospora kogelbergensis TaxID=1337665 RepID=A0AAW0QGT4_9PEZI